MGCLSLFGVFKEASSHVGAIWSFLDFSLMAAQGNPCFPSVIPGNSSFPGIPLTSLLCTSPRRVPMAERRSHREGAADVWEAFHHASAPRGCGQVLHQRLWDSCPLLVLERRPKAKVKAQIFLVLGWKNPSEPPQKETLCHWFEFLTSGRSSRGWECLAGAGNAARLAPEQLGSMWNHLFLCI